MIGKNLQQQLMQQQRNLTQMHSINDNGAVPAEMNIQHSNEVYPLNVQLDNRRYNLHRTSAQPRRTSPPHQTKAVT